MKKIIAAILCGVMAVGTLTACQGKQALLDDEKYGGTGYEETSGGNSSQSGNTQGTGVEYKEMANYEPLKAGDKIAVITVKDFGTIKIKLFPEFAPKGVENFIGLAEMGYYDELIFHRVIEGFVAQGGDPKGTGEGGNSVWGADFDLETSEYLYHVTGAVAYAHAQYGGNGSQFYIVNTQPGMTFNGEAMEMTDEFLTNFNVPDSVKEIYKTDGGTPILDGGYTVFGQVIEGMDVVYAISAVEVDPQTSKPVKQVLIEKVEIVDYQGE